MAKSRNLWLRQTKQRLGGAVTYVLKGQQIIREQAAQISNPRTSSQMSQRVKLANVVAMYKANRNWMEKYAFEDKKSTWSAYNAFVSANLAGNTVALTKQEAAAGCCIVAPYRMTSGSLPSVEVNETSSGLFETNLSVGSSFVLADATVALLSEALLASNNVLQAGDQISLIVNYQVESGTAYAAVVRQYEVIINTSDTTPLSDRMDVAHLTVSNGNLAFTTGLTDPTLGFMFCLSRDDGSKVRVSTQSLILNDPAIYQSFSEDSKWEEARQSYGTTGGTPFLAAGYASGASQGGSNPDVPIANSILQAKLGVGDWVNVGAHLGGVTPATSPTLYVRLSQTPSATPSAVKMTFFEGGNISAANIIAEGSMITANFNSYAGNSPVIIQSVVVTIDGVDYSANFAQYDESDDGVTE